METIQLHVRITIAPGSDYQVRLTHCILVTLVKAARSLVRQQLRCNSKISKTKDWRGQRCETQVNVYSN